MGGGGGLALATAVEEKVAAAKVAGVMAGSAGEEEVARVAVAMVEARAG